jgi:hypothetical protein
MLKKEGEESMTKPQRSRQARQAARDKSTIDHLMSGPVKPRMNSKSSDAHEYSEREGRKLERAIHEEWTPDKGGLPDF